MIARVILIAALAAVSASAADVYLIKNAVVHTMAGETVEKGSVVIQDGKIAGVGRDLKAPRGAQVIDAEGLHLYPGMFDAFTQIGLTEISAVVATSDASEKGDFNPHLESAIAVNPESVHLPVARANGVTHAVTAMTGGIIAGQASVVNLDGWTWEEMAIEKDGPLVVNWPTIRVYPESDDMTPEQRKERPTTFKAAKEKYDESVAKLQQWIEASRHYAEKKKTGLEPGDVDSRLEATLPLIDGSKPMMVQADEARAIRQAIEFAEQQRIKLIIVGGAEAEKVADLLKEKDVPVILGLTQEIVKEEDAPYDRLYSQPAKLHEAGVRFAISTQTYYLSKTLPYEAGTAVAYGLSQEEAMKSVTVYPAQILGLDKQLGTIEEGKIANLILTDGDPLEIRTQVQKVFIQGKLSSTDNKPLELYEKYLRRLEP